VSCSNLAKGILTRPRSLLRMLKIVLQPVSNRLTEPPSNLRHLVDNDGAFGPDAESGRGVARLSTAPSALIFLKPALFRLARGKDR